MMPKKTVAHRQQSPPARCGRVVESFLDRDGRLKDWTCGAELQLVITRSPLRLFAELVVERCTVGHLQCSAGVLPEEVA